MTKRNFMEPSRRAFLVGLGAAGGMVGLETLFPVIAAAAEAAGKAAGGARAALEIQRVKTACSVCVNFCGLDVTVVNGIVRTIYPDQARADFYNHGICPKGASGMFNTYDPYRLKKPLKRTNPNRGPDEDPKWVEIGWEEAFSTIADRLRKIKSEDPRKLLWQHGQGKYLIGDNFAKAFTKAFGTPNMTHRATACEAARHVADELTWAGHGILPDLKHTKLLLNFGANYFEGEQTARWLDWQTTMSREEGMKVVVVEPRLSSCAAKADEWVPVRPGKDVVMLLAMARTLIEAGTIDEDFLVNYTNAPELVGEDGKIFTTADGKSSLVWDTVTGGARPFTAEVKPALKGSHAVDGKSYRTAFQVLADNVQDITPQYAEEVCGVPAATIVRLAEMFAQEARIGETIVIDGQTLRHRPVALYTFRGLSAKEHGVQGWRAGLILNMLVGSIDAVGGLMLGGPYGHPEYFDVAKCEYPPNRADLGQSVFFPGATHHVAQMPLLTVQDPKAWGLEYVPEVQIFYATNRPVSIPDAWKQFDGLKKTFNVVIDVLMSETAWYADIVLPDKTYLEAWHYPPTRSTPEASHKAIRHAMVNPYNLEHDAFTILWELMKRLGLRDQYIEEINEAWQLKTVTFQPGRDYTPREAVEVIWTDQTQKDFSVALTDGFVGSKKNTEEKYLSGVEAKFKGGGKPKMKLYADQLIGTYEKVEEIARKNNLTQIDLAKYKIAYSPVPTKEHAFPTPHREATGYPLYLITHKRMYRDQSAFTANNVILNQALGPDVATNFVTINAVTAQQLGIKSGDKVVIETRVGKVSGTADVVQGIRPDTVAVSYHHGTFSPGLAPAARRGTWINQVLEYHPDLISGHNSFNDTKCRLAIDQGAPS